MNKTETKSIRLCFNLHASPHSVRDQSLTDLWEVLKKNTIEPGQAPTSLLSSFANECLLCALILKKGEDEAEDNDMSPLEPSSSSETTDNTVGLIYVCSSSSHPSAKEVSVGVVIRKDMQRKGYAQDAMQLALAWVFGSLQFHRAQAAILDTPDKDSALLFFNALGFVHEGTRRRSVYQPSEHGEWKDVTYLAMLDTDWFVRKSAKLRGRTLSTLWDEMFNRHAREREELLEWEENNQRIRRSTSMETVRVPAASKRAERLQMTATQREQLSWESDESPSSRESSVVDSRSSSPGPNIFIDPAEDEDDESNVPDENDTYSPTSPRALPPWVCGDSQFWLNASSSRLRVLPSIPSTRRGSRIESEYPITIPSSPSSPPPDTPSAAADSSAGESDSEKGGPPPPGSVALRRASDSYPVGSRPKRRRGSSASTSTLDSWSDAQSSFNGTSEWDMMDSGTEA